MNVAIYLYPDVEVLDFAGPFEVFTTATRVAKLLGVDGDTPLFDVRMVAQDLGPIRARGGLVIQPGFAISDDHPSIDILMIPGGIVTAELGKKAVVDWIRRTATLARITASVCTGAFLLAEAGLLQNKRATTHWDDLQDLRRGYRKYRCWRIVAGSMRGML